MERKLLVLVDNVIQELPIGDTVDLSILSKAFSFWKKGTGTVLSGEEILLDTIPLLKFHSAKYIISVFNDTEKKSKTFEFSVNYNFDEVKSNVSGIVGDAIPTKISEIINGENIEIYFKNNEIFKFDIEFSKIVLG